MTIGWIEISLKQYGGNLYNEQAREALSKEFDVELVNREAKIFKYFRPLKLVESLLRLLALSGKKDAWVRDFYSILTMPFDRTQGKQIAMVHHVDFSGFPLFARFVFFFLQKLFYYNLKRVDVIVTVSEYWKQHFLQMGYQRVYKISNGFDLSEYKITDEEVEEFKKQYNLEGKPIIYLGNCQKIKGVKEAYKILRDLNVHFVTSGKRMVKIPAQNLEIGRRDYFKLLKASTVILAMSKLKEGWGRTAHEALLLGTPVIGSGSAGMKELLDGGGQIVSDFKDLKEKVQYILLHPRVQKEMVDRGYIFAKDFTMERFEREWIQFAKQLL